MSVQRDQVGLSELYLAAREGNAAKIEEILPALSLYELNRLEPNGSTALHAAVYYGHVDVVERLVRHKAVFRRRRNAYNRMPAEETENEEIKLLLGQQDVPYKSRERFKNDLGIREMEVYSLNSDPSNAAMEENRLKWFDAYQNASRIAAENKEYMHKWLTKIPLHKILETIKTNYIQTMTEFDENHLNKIKTYLDDALEENHMRYLVYVYTMPEITFYSRFNRDLASRGSGFRFESHVLDKYRDDEPPKDLGPFLFAAAIMHHPSLSTKYYTGTTYRGMSINQFELNQYVVGARVITNTFLSTSTTIDMSDYFMIFTDPTLRPVLCVYRTTQLRTSLDIRDISAVKDEDEVLILPFTVFRVQRVDIDGFQFYDGKATVIFLDQDTDEFKLWAICPTFTDRQQTQLIDLLSSDSGTEKNDSTSEELASNNRIDFYQAFISKLEETTQNQMPWSLHKNLLVNFLIDIAVYIQESSLSNEIEEFDLRYICCTTIKTQNPPENNTYQLIYTFVHLIKTKSLEILVPRHFHRYGFLNEELQNFFTSLYLVRRELHLDVDVVANRFLHYMTDSRYYRPLRMALEYIFSKWTSDDADSFYQLLLNENQKLPLGSILLIIALPQLLYCVPSSRTINTAFDLFMLASSIHKWLIYFPIFMQYFNTVLDCLPSELTSQWLTHYLNMYSNSASLDILIGIFLQKIHHDHRIPTFFTCTHCEALQIKLTIDDDVKTPIDRLLVAISIFDNRLIPKNDLSNLLSTSEITKMHPSRLALIIALHGGLYREQQDEVIFSPKHIHRSSSIPYIQLLNNDVHWFEKTIEQKSEEDISQDVVDLFVAWICLVGVEKPWIYEKFAKWPAFHRAIARFRRIGLYLNECYVIDYAEFKEAASIKNIVTKVLKESNSIVVTRSIVTALARLVLPNGKYSFFLKNDSKSSIVHLLNLPLPKEVLFDMNNSDQELIYLFPLLFPILSQSMLYSDEINDRARQEILYGIDFLFNLVRRHQTLFLLSLISKPLQALYASLLDNGTLPFTILLVEIGIQLFQKRRRGGVYYSLILALIRNEYERHNLCSYYRGLVCLCTIRDEAKHDFVMFDEDISRKDQGRAFGLPLHGGKKEKWLPIELDKEHRYTAAKSDIYWYVRSVSLAILSAASYEKHEIPGLYVSEVKNRISLLSQLPLRLHALIVFHTLELASTSDEFDNLNNMTLSLLPSFEVSSIGLHAWLYLLWLFAFAIPDNTKAIRSGLKLILDRLDTNNDQDSILVQQATCESLFSLDPEEHPSVRSRIYQIVRRNHWSNDASAVSRIFHIDSNPFINSPVNWNLLNAEQTTLVASMYLVQLSVDVHKLLSWFEKPLELDRNWNELYIIRLIHECNNDHCLSEKAELAINNLLRSRDAKDDNAREALWIHTFKKPWPMDYSNDSSANERQFLDESEYIQTNPALINNPFIIIQICYLMLHCDNDIFYGQAHTYLNVESFFSSKLRIQGLVDLFHLIYQSYRNDLTVIQKLFSEIDLRIDEDEHLKIVLDWERKRIAASHSMNANVLELKYGLKLQKQDLTRSLLDCIRVSLITSKTKTCFFQLANDSVLTLVDEPDYLTELVRVINRHWIGLKSTHLSREEQQLVFSLISIFYHSPPFFQKAIVQAFIPNRSVYPDVLFGTFNEARQFIKDILIKAAKEPINIDEEVLALMIQHYYHNNEDDDESLLMQLTTCSWSKTISQAADIIVVQLFYSTSAKFTFDDLVAIFDGRYLPLYHAMMFAKNNDFHQWKTLLAAQDLIIAHAEDLLTLFVEELYSSLVDSESFRPSNHIQVAVALLEKIPTKLRSAIKKHNDDKDQSQEKFKRALLTMSEQFDSNSCESFELLIMLYGELTLEISNIFLTIAKCPPKQRKGFSGHMQHIKQANCRDVVEHLHERLATSLSLQQRYVAACLLVQLAKHDQVSIREVQRVLSEAMNDQQVMDGSVIITNDSEKTGEKERFGQALFDLLLELSFLSSSLFSSRRQDTEKSVMKLDTNNFNWEFGQIIGADRYASCILVEDHPLHENQ